MGFNRKCVSGITVLVPFSGCGDRMLQEEISCIEKGARQKGPAVEQEYFDYAQAGAFIGKSAEAIRGYVNRGMLRATRRGGKLRFISRSELARFCGGL